VVVILAHSCSDRRNSVQNIRYVYVWSHRNSILGVHQLGEIAGVVAWCHVVMHGIKYCPKYQQNRGNLRCKIYPELAYTRTRRTKARFPLPELTARVEGWSVSITRQLGPSTRVVETGLNWTVHLLRNITYVLHFNTFKYETKWQIMEYNDIGLLAVTVNSDIWQACVSQRK